MFPLAGPPLRARPGAALLGFFEVGFTKERPRGLVDEEAHFVGREHTQVTQGVLRFLVAD